MKKGQDAIERTCQSKGIDQHVFSEENTEQKSIAGTRYLEDPSMLTHTEVQKSQGNI